MKKFMNQLCSFLLEHKKMFLAMRNSLFIILIGAFQSIAGISYAQSTRLSLDMKNSSVKEVLQQIEQKSEFYFLYNDELIDVHRKVDINVDNEGIDVILSKLFSSEKVNILVRDRHIILTPVNENISQQPNLKVTGKVTDQTGAPIPGASIMVKGTTIGITTSNDGSFSLSLPVDAKVLVVSFVGMKSQELTIGGRSTMNIKMEEESIGLEEVVAIGYGTKSKKTLTGAISVISSEVMENRPAAKTTDLLQGVSNGVQITRFNTGDIKGSANQITIRGATSRSAPGVLVVVDGVAQASTDASALDNINPDAIESISILKDGQAAIYGARAAGGVILVTTKAGKTDKPTINFSATATVQSPSLMRKATNILELFEMQNEGYVNDGQLTNDFTNPLKYIADNNITLAKIKENNGQYILREPYGNDHPYALADYDWNNIMWDPALQQNYNLSISGKTDKLNYYESINYLNQDGMLAYGSNYKKRLLVTLKNDYNVTSFLKIKSNFTIGNQNVVEPQGYSSPGYYGVQSSMFFTLPVIRPFTEGGHLMNIGGFTGPIGWARDNGSTIDQSYMIHGTLGAELTPVKNLLIAAEVSANYDLKETDYASISFPMYDYYDQTETLSENINGVLNNAGADYNRNRYSIGNFYTRYTYDKLENHKINLMAGYSHEENDYRFFNGSRMLGLISAQLPTMGAGSADFQYNYEVKNQYALNSVYSRLEYGFKNRYLFEGVFRYDGSSKFAEGHKWAPFFGLSGGWIISDESFMKDLNKVVDFLKLRASWGQLGNQTGIGLYDYLSQINIGGGYPMGSYSSPYPSERASLGSMASTSRTWETIESQDFGLDFKSLNSRLSGTVDIYIKDNKNMFFNQEFPQVLGTTPPNINGAHLRTKGWELELGWRDKIQDFNYFVKVNMSNNNNKVIDLADDLIPSEGVNTFVQGYPTSSYFGYQYDGRIQTDAELTSYNSSLSAGIPNNLRTGDARYKDLNGDGKLTALPYKVDKDGKPTATSGDMIQFGEGGQHYLYGINLGVSWKNFDFSSFFQGVLRWNVVNQYIIPDGAWYEPNDKYFYHQTWAADRTSALFPKLSQNFQVNNNNYRFSNAPYKMFNNKYIRLKNIQVGYNVPKNITDKLNIDKLRVYFSGTDIWEHDNLPGNLDPETPFTQTLSPFPRQYSFGLNLTF